MSLNADQSQVINIADVLRGVWRRKMLLASLGLIGLGIGIGVVTLFKPSYQTEAQINIENTTTSFERAATDTNAPDIKQIDDRTISSQVSVIKSGDLYGRVVDQLGLDKDPELNTKLAPQGTLKKLLILAGFAEDSSLFTDRESAIKSMASKVSVSNVQDSNTISITSRMGNNKVAADVANALADAYIATTREGDAGSTERARTWLGGQIADLRLKVSESENAAEKYRAEAGLLKGSSATLGIQQMSELNSQIGVAETAAGEAKARADEIRRLLSSGSIEVSSDVLSSPLIQNLREQQAAATRKVSELSATYLPNHPKMIAAQKELISINNSVRREALKVVDSLQGQAKIANDRAQSLRTNLEKIKGREGDANISDVKLKSLEREAQANRALLESMLARYADASARQDASQQPSKARIIQRAAVPPTPYFPKIGPTLFLTTMAGLGLGLGLAFIMEVMSAAAGTTRNPRSTMRKHIATAQVEQSFEIPPLMPEGKIATEPTANPIISIQASKQVADGLHAVAQLTTTGTRIAAIELMAGDGFQIPEAAKVLAQACQNLKDTQSIKSVSFTSLGSEGPDAAFVTLNVARALAENKKRVAIIDVSQMGGDIEMLAGLPASTGLTDLLLGSADFTKIISRDPHSTVHIIRKGLSRDPLVGTRVADKIESVITALNSIYDFVLVHAGEAFSEAPQLVKNCPAAFILASSSRQRDVFAAGQVLKNNGIIAPMFVQVDPTVAAELRASA